MTTADVRPDAPAPSARSVEQRGIEYVPLSARWGGPFNLLGLVGRRRVERRVPAVRLPRCHHFPAVVRPGRSDDHHRQSVLPADGPGQPAGTAGGDDHVHGQPGRVRAAWQQGAVVLQLADPGRVRDRGHRPDRVRRDHTGRPRWAAGRHPRQGHLHRGGGGHSGGAAPARARRRAEGAAAAGGPVRRAVCDHGHHHQLEGAPARRRARSRVGRHAGVPGPGHRRGWPRLVGERERLLALPATADVEGQDRAGRHHRRGRPVSAAGDPRRRRGDRRPRCGLDHRPDREFPRAGSSCPT